MLFLSVVPRESSSSHRKALHRVGGLVFDTHGSHFANELEGRDYVIGEMWKNEPPLGLAMNKAISDEIAWHANVTLDAES